MINRFFTPLIVMAFVGAQGIGFLAGSPQETSSASPSQTADFLGRWRVAFTISGVGEKNLIFDSQASGSGSFLFLDAGPDSKPMTTPLPAVWSKATNNRVSFSGEVELPIGTCCREMGTLIFKGKLDSTSFMSGKAIFVGGTIDEENFNGFRSTVGIFTATRVVK